MDRYKISADQVAFFHQLQGVEPLPAGRQLDGQFFPLLPDVDEARG